MEQIIDNEYFRNLVSQMRDTGYPQEIDRVQINIPNAEKRLRGGLQYVVNMKSGCDAEWNERNYRPIVDWMTDNKGKGIVDVRRLRIRQVGNRNVYPSSPY